MTDLCNCPSKGDTDAEVERCRVEQEFESRHEHDEPYRLVCTRPAGHDGPHSACTVYHHPAETWGNDDG